VKIGEVLRKSTKIYKVDHDEDVVRVAKEKLTLEQFHRWMGHISIDVAWKLVKDGMVTGIRLEYTLELLFLQFVCLCQSNLEIGSKDERGAEC